MAHHLFHNSCLAAKIDHTQGVYNNTKSKKLIAENIFTLSSFLILFINQLVSQSLI
jgi:hypothetical protein